MGAARLILIEGMIGSGKTTTAMQVGDWLAPRGRRAGVLRGRGDHPIRTRAEDRLRAAADPQALGQPGGAAGGAAGSSPRAYPDDQWRRLAERCLRGQQTVIVEGSFLQNSVMPAFIDGTPGRLVSEIFTRIQRQAEPTRPLLVYLRPADIGAAIERVHRVRGNRGPHGTWPSWRTTPGRAAVVRLY